MQSTEPTRVVKTCTDMDLTSEQLQEANRIGAELGLLERPSRDSIGEELAVTQPWRNGTIISVRFLGGETSVRKRVEHYAHQWEEFANIKFKFVDQGSTVARIAFVPNAGSWSFLGAGNLLHWFSQDAPTMNYGWLTPDTPDEEYSRVVLHEFGHLLSCIHEHQQPAAGIPWDKEKAYAYYSSANGWSRAQVDAQVFNRYNRLLTQFSEFDPTSIMMYPVPAELTVGGFSVGWNTHLSDTDKAFIGQMYPLPH